jgi:CRISPR-associated endonuclease Csn1
MKKILGLDLGTTSIGWAFVHEAENETEQSNIIKIGARISQLDNFDKVDKNGKVTESKNPMEDFASGKGLSPNAGRTQKRGARRNLQRVKLRRENLIEILKENRLITEETILAEQGNKTTFETLALRAKAATEQISKTEFARVLLAINKKRGYKSSRKAKNEEEGQAIDGMVIALTLYNEKLTPGQYCLPILQSGKKKLPDFYRSDLQAEFNIVWSFQKQFYPEILTDELKKSLKDKNRNQTWAICQKPFNIIGIKRNGNAFEKKIEEYKFRNEAINNKIGLEELAIVLQEINNNLNQSSGYLGAISDRSKELYFNKQTVGQYLYKQIQENPHTRLKGQVFYRQDYMDEFELLWETQKQFHSELTDSLKEEIRDVVIFYQRKLKSQKGLISFCEFECTQKEIMFDGKTKLKTVGARVAPKSSPLFQEFKIWQILSNVIIRKKGTKEEFVFSLETKQQLFDELNIKGNMKKTRFLNYLDVNQQNGN